jgi:hypothetical protein
LFQALLVKARAGTKIPLIKLLFTQFLTEIMLSGYLIGQLTRLLIKIKFLKIILVPEFFINFKIEFVNHSFIFTLLLNCLFLIIFQAIKLIH